MDWTSARSITVRQPAPKSRRRSIDSLLDQARERERRALAAFQRRNASVQKYEALKKCRDRKLETRRKIIAGALALEHMKHNAAFAASFTAVLDRYVEKAPERMLFGLHNSDSRQGRRQSGRFGNP